MKNKHIEHAHREVRIYRDYYKPSFSPARFFKSIFGVLLFGTTSVAHNYAPVVRRRVSK